jgi:hypothetical protein
MNCIKDQALHYFNAETSLSYLQYYSYGLPGGVMSFVRSYCRSWAVWACLPLIKFALFCCIHITPLAAVRGNDKQYDLNGHSHYLKSVSVWFCCILDVHLWLRQGRGFPL